MSLANQENDGQEGIHDRLEYISYKAVRIPNKAENKRSTTEILELIKLKR